MVEPGYVQTHSVVERVCGVNFQTLEALPFELPIVDFRLFLMPVDHLSLP